MMESGYLRIPWRNGSSKDGDILFFYGSDKMVRVVEMIGEVAATDVTVLVGGESGVGKEVVARAIHSQSGRNPKPLIKVNCAALPEQLLESELFGYERGAFTGAYRPKPGKFELANGGTILLDEIAEISLSLQAKLLQVLQDGEFSRLGGRADLRVDVRVVAATNKDLEEHVRAGRFREDLFYRLNVVKIDIPPLRQRKEEIPILVQYLVEKYAQQFGKPAPVVSQEAKGLLMGHDWPGNVRELENTVKRFVILGDEEVIKKELNRHGSKELPELETKEAETKRPKAASLKAIGQNAAFQVERETISNTLEQTRWNRRKAAEILGISYNGLRNKIKLHELDREPALDDAL